LNWCNMHVGLWSDLELIQDACKSQIWSWTDARCTSVSDLILNLCKIHVELRSDLELMQDVCWTSHHGWCNNGLVVNVWLNIELVYLFSGISTSSVFQRNQPPTKKAHSVAGYFWLYGGTSNYLQVSNLLGAFN
jgi:hypothetical protein